MFRVTEHVVSPSFHPNLFLVRRDPNRTLSAPHSKIVGLDRTLYHLHMCPSFFIALGSFLKRETDALL
jgi:hypothetical protein